MLLLRVFVGQLSKTAWRQKTRRNFRCLIRKKTFYRTWLANNLRGRNIAGIGIPVDDERYRTERMFMPKYGLRAKSDLESARVDLDA